MVNVTWIRCGDDANNTRTWQIVLLAIEYRMVNVTVYGYGVVTTEQVPCRRVRGGG